MNSRIEHVKVRLKAEWLGHMKGAELTLNSSTAKTLISRGAAEKIEDKEVKIKDAPQTTKNKMQKVARKKRS